MFLFPDLRKIYSKEGYLQFPRRVVTERFTFLGASESHRFTRAKTVEPVNELAAGIEDSEVDVALPVLSSSVAEFPAPYFLHGFRELGVIPVAMPGGGDERLQGADYGRINERGPTDLRGRSSAMPRGQVAVLSVDDDEKNRPLFPQRSLLRFSERGRPVDLVHGEVLRPGTEARVAFERLLYLAVSGQGEGGRSKNQEQADQRSSHSPLHAGGTLSTRLS